MIENRPWLNFFCHVILILGVAVVALPVYIALIASTRGPNDFYSGIVPLLPGPHTIENYKEVLFSGISTSGAPPIGSTRTTSAPSWARVIPPNGAATKDDTSTTRIPASGSPAAEFNGDSVLMPRSSSLRSRRGTRHDRPGGPFS